MTSLTPILARLAENAGAADAAADLERWKAFFSVTALVVALLGFLAVLAYLFLRGNRKIHERARHLPLEEE